MVISRSNFLDSSLSVESHSDWFICLHELIKLSYQIFILDCEYICQVCLNSELIKIFIVPTPLIKMIIANQSLKKLPFFHAFLLFYSLACLLNFSQIFILLNISLWLQNLGVIILNLDSIFLLIFWRRIFLIYFFLLAYGFEKWFLNQLILTIFNLRNYFWILILNYSNRNIFSNLIFLVTIYLTFLRKLSLRVKNFNVLLARFLIVFSVARQFLKVEISFWFKFNIFYELFSNQTIFIGFFNH